MLIMGEAGVGKSRLVAAAADAVTEAGAVVLTGWCLPLAGAVPFLPVTDVLRPETGSDARGCVGVDVAGEKLGGLV
jgi:predicted ATPase